jgi:hypothetical protein
MLSFGTSWGYSVESSMISQNVKLRILTDRHHLQTWAMPDDVAIYIVKFAPMSQPSNACSTLLGADGRGLHFYTPSPLGAYTKLAPRPGQRRGPLLESGSESKTGPWSKRDSSAFLVGSEYCYFMVDVPCHAPIGTQICLLRPLRYHSFWS